MACAGRPLSKGPNALEKQGLRKKRSKASRRVCKSLLFRIRLTDRCRSLGHVPSVHTSPCFSPGTHGPRLKAGDSSRRW